MASTRDLDKLVLLGRIGAAHGISGEVRIKSFTQEPLDIGSYGDLLDPKGNRSFSIQKSRLAKGMVIARLKGVTDRNQVEALNGVDLYVARDALSDPNEEDEFFYSDLEGLEARLTDGSKFGIIKAVVNYGASDILEIKTPKSGTQLLAFTKDVVPEVKVADGYVIVVPPQEIIAQEPNQDEADEN